MYKKNIVTFHFLQYFQFYHFLYIGLVDSIFYNRKLELQMVFQTIKNDPLFFYFEKF